MIKKYLLVMLVLLSLEAEELDRTGPYIALGGGYALYEDGRQSNLKMEPSYNINFIAGAFINKYLSVELALDYYNEFQSKDLSDSAKAMIIDVDTKAHYSFWHDQIDLYGAFGAGQIFWSENVLGVGSTSTSAVLRGDIGIGYRIGHDYTLNIGARRYFFNLEQLDDTYNMNINSFYTNLEVQF